MSFLCFIARKNADLDPWCEDKKLFCGQILKGEVVLVAEYGYLINLPNFVVSCIPMGSTDIALKKGKWLKLKSRQWIVLREK